MEEMNFPGLLKFWLEKKYTVGEMNFTGLLKFLAEKILDRRNGEMSLNVEDQRLTVRSEIVVVRADPLYTSCHSTDACPSPNGAC